jgi:hypothetical protein
MRAGLAAILLALEKGVKFLFILFGKCNKSTRRVRTPSGA